MKRWICLLLVLTMLLSVVPALGVSAAETAKAPAVQDFEDVSLGITEDKWPGYKSHKAADIAPAPDKIDDQAIRLHDTQGEVIPEYLHGFESASDLVVEFDYYPTDENPVSLRLLNDNVAYANTAFWLQLRNTGVWAYDGTYSKISEQAFTVNAWNHVRLEVTTGAQAKAVVYLNDEYAGTATKPSQIGSNAATVDGFYFQATNATQDVYLDNLEINPAYYYESFEQLNLGASAAGMAGYKSDFGSVVEADPADANGKALALVDSANTTWPSVHYTFDSLTQFAVELKVYTAQSNYINIQLLNGSRSYANSAFWLQLRSNGVYSYDATESGSAGYVKVGDQGFTVNTWTHVRLEVTVGSKLDIYVNGVFVGTANKPASTVVGSNAASVNGVYISSAQYKNVKFYLDDLKVQLPAGEPLTFDNLGTTGTVEGLPGFVAQYGATVVENPTVPGEKVMQLVDTTNTSAPYYHAQVADTNAMVLEFDLYMTEDNSVSVQLLNGARNEKNTAFWLQLRSTSVSSYDRKDDGTKGYVAVSATGFTLGQWNKIRIRVTTGDRAEAVVYINGKYAGTAQKPDSTVVGSNASTINGAYIALGQKNRAVYLDNLKLGSPLVLENGILRLLEDDAVDTMLVDANTTLDLQGHSLSVKDMICFGGVVDSVGGGQVLTQNMILNQLPYLPVYDAQIGGYRFFAYAMNNLGKRTNADGSQTYGFALDIAQQAYEILASGDCQVDFHVSLSWGDQEKTFAFSSALVQEYAALQQRHPTTQAALMLTITGLDTLAPGTKLSVTPILKAAGAAVEGMPMGDNQPSDPDLPDELLEIQMGGLFDIADNTEKQGLPEDDPIVKEDFSTSGGVYGYTQFPNATYDPETGLVYINYARHRDVVVDYPYDSTKVYDVNTLLNAQAGAQLQDKYVDMQTENTMFFTAMAKLKDGRLFAQNYVAYYLNSTSATTYSWIVDKSEGEVVPKIAPQGFESLSVGTDLSSVFASGTTMATVSDAKAFNGSHSAYLADTSTSSAALLRVQTDKSAVLELDFAYQPVVAALNLRITNGGRSDGNTAFFLQLANRAGSDGVQRTYLRYYTGSAWVDLHQFEGTLNNKWTQFHVESDVNGVTKVWADGVLIGEVLRTGGNYGKNVSTEIDSMIFECGDSGSTTGRMYLDDILLTIPTENEAPMDTWTQIQGKLTLPSSLTLNGAQPGTTWYRYGFSRCLIELDDGTLLGSMYGSYGTILVQSKDLGKTWTYRSTIAESAIGLEKPYINTDGTDITWFEPAVTRCADGSLLCVMRTWRDKPLYQTRSYDDGLTWTEPTLLPGLDPAEGEGMSIYPQLLLLSNGVLALATGVPNDTVYFSLDGCGYNWDYGITTYDGDTTGNAGIAELSYDPKTDTVTLLALGDKGFQNESLAGVWGRIVTVKRNHAAASKPDSAKASVERYEVGVGATLQARVEALFDTDGKLVQKDYSVRWYSLTPAVATIDQNGKITTVGIGTAKIQALVTCGGQTVTTNEIQVQVLSRDTLADLEVTPSKWVLKVSDSGTLAKVAYNACGQEIVTRVTKQEYFDGDPAKPKYYAGTVTWEFASRNSKVVTVNNQTGAYQAVGAGVTQIVAIAMKGNTKLTREITVIVESGNWVTQNFESTTLPANCITNNLVSLSTKQAYSGSRSLYLNDNSATLAPMLRFEIPESRGVIVEFMLYVESNTHSPSFGVGTPDAEDKYNYSCNSAFVGLLYNPLTGAQGYQGYDGTAWSVNNRANVIPIKQWNKIRLEVTVDKPSRLYVNGSFVAEMPLAANNKLLDTLFFLSGGVKYTGDAFYVDDIRYMTFS